MNQRTSSTEYDIGDMLDTWMERYEDNPDAAPSLQVIWPDCPPALLEALQARLTPLLDGRACFVSHDDEVGEPLSHPDLKEGYRPDPTSSYELVEKLGQGGFGEVWWACSQRRRRRSVAIKFCTQLTPGHIEALHNELSKVQVLDHAGIVKLEEEHLDAAIPFLKYEFIDGIDLGKFLDGSPLNPNHAAAIILKLAEIMAYVHSRPDRIIHRDLKPANILISNRRDLAALAALGIHPDVRLATLKVMDFGMAGHSREAGRGGTKGYMSPQQMGGAPPDPSDDVFAIGVIWYELLGGGEYVARPLDVLLATTMISVGMEVPRLGCFGNGSTSGSQCHNEFKTRGMSDEQLKVLVDCLEENLENRIPNAVELEKRIRAVYDLDELQGVFEQVKEGAECTTSLSVEMATLLAKGVTTLTPEIARALVKCEGLDTLALDRVSSLSVEAAQALSMWSGTALSLNGLRALRPELAHALARWEGHSLDLNGLTALTPEVAQALASWQGEWLILDGLTKLTPEAVEALAGWEGAGKALSFNGLTTLMPETAEALARWAGESLALNGLTMLTPEVAQALAGWNGQTLFLLGLTTLSVQMSATDVMLGWGDI